MWWAIFLGFLCLAVAMLGYVRLAPSDPDVWHIDPADGNDPGDAGLRLVGQDAPRFPGHSSDVLETFSEIVTASPRTRRLDGGVDEGMVTFVIRSATFGFPDYLSVKATDEGTETKLSILSRARFGTNDLGVNRARLDGWLAELDRALR